jgi:hypothetical protein
MRGSRHAWGIAEEVDVDAGRWSKWAGTKRGRTACAPARDESRAGLRFAAGAAKGLAAYTLARDGIATAAVRVRSRGGDGLTADAPSTDGGAPSRLKIDIVGDSMLVTRQLLGQIRATKPHISKSLHQSRSALLELFDYGLHHTLRVGNKTADWLANYAMDQQISIISTTATAMQACTVHAALCPRVRTDTTHPWTQITKNNDLLTRIQTLASSYDHLPSFTSAKRPRPESLSPTPKFSRPKPLQRP